MSFDLKTTVPVAASAILAADRMAVGTLLPSPSWEGLEFQNVLEAAILRSIGRMVANGASGITVTGDIRSSGGVFTGDGSGLTNLPSGGNSFPMPYRTPVNPTLTSFNWQNQGTASVAATANTIYLSDTNGYNTENLRIRNFSAPATPYTVTMGFAFNVHYLVEIQNAGIVFRNSGSGKCITYGYINRSNGGPYPCSFKFTDSTTFSATVFEASIGWAAAPAFYVRVTDDGTNRKHYISVNGVNWTLQFSEGRTTFATCDQIGFYSNPIGSGSGASRENGIILFDWQVT